jgi:hypothetical protein
MKRLALVLVLSGAVGCAVWATRAVAFDMSSDNGVNPHGTERFADPDDQLTPGLLQVAPDVQDYQGTANQLTPDQSGWIFSIAPQR